VALGLTDGLITMGVKKGGKGGTFKGKGFGFKQPTLADVVASMKSRLPEHPESTMCACGSNEPYGACCEPYHLGFRVAKSCERLIRTRYSAFAYRQPVYIVNTTHPVNRDYRADTIEWVELLDARGMFDSFEFESLVIGGDEGESTEERFLDFTVTLRAAENDGGITAGQELTVSERSRFLPNADGSGWLYASGEVRAQVDGLENAILNG
jgi:SEC-C motif-containing protein